MAKAIRIVIATCSVLADGNKKIYNHNSGHVHPIKTLSCQNLNDVYIPCIYTLVTLHFIICSNQLELHYSYIEQSSIILM